MPSSDQNIEKRSSAQITSSIQELSSNLKSAGFMDFFDNPPEGATHLKLTVNPAAAKALYHDTVSTYKDLTHEHQDAENAAKARRAKQVLLGSALTGLAALPARQMIINSAAKSREGSIAARLLSVRPPKNRTDAYIKGLNIGGSSRINQVRNAAALLGMFGGPILIAKGLLDEDKTLVGLGTAGMLAAHGGRAFQYRNVPGALKRRLPLMLWRSIPGAAYGAGASLTRLYSLREKDQAD